ncbi:unnamed protein product, partial [Effrenium voratum]
MSLIDSEAAFKTHCDRVDSSGGLWQILDANELRTFSALGFAIGTPQSPPSEDEFRAFSTRLNAGTAMSMGESARLKRVHFEACTMIVAHLRSQVNQETGGETIWKLPTAEKIARLELQQARLGGISITGDLQPSFALVDLATMCETNAVVWIAPSRCSKREHEVQLSTKAKPQIVSVEQNSLRLTSSEQDTKADVSTELQWQFAMQRRGIAFDQSGLIAWNTHQRWTQQLLATLMREPPIGFVKVHLEQVTSADRELFSLISAELQKATTVLTATPPPMAVEMEKLRRQGSQCSYAAELQENASKRTRIQWKWTQRAKELSADEKSFKQRLPPHMAELLKKKRIKLLGEMLADLKYPDAHLAEDIAAGLRLAWTAYFDDYTNFSAENTASNAEGAITGLFNLLGLDFAQSGDKALKYSQEFKALGVCFDLSEASEGRASIGHTAERRSEIELVLTDDILDK